MKNIKFNMLRTPEVPPKKRIREITTEKEKGKLEMLPPSGRSNSPVDQGNNIQPFKQPVILNKGKEKMIEPPPKQKNTCSTMPVGFQTKGVKIGLPAYSPIPVFGNTIISAKSKDKSPVNENAKIFTKSKEKPSVNENAMINSTKSKDKPSANENTMIISAKSKGKSIVNENAKISTKSKEKPSVNENAMFISAKSKENPPVTENAMISTKSKDKTPTEVGTETKTPKRRVSQKSIDALVSGGLICPQDVVDAGMHVNPAKKSHYAWFSLTPLSDQSRKDTLQLLVQPYVQITMDGECDADVSILMKYIVLQFKHVCQDEVGIFMNGKRLDPEMKLLDVVKQWNTFVGSEKKITKIGSSAENFCVKLTYARRERE